MDLAKLGRGPQKQCKVMITTKNNKVDSCKSKEEMDHET